MVDQNGDAATYQYDAVGNLTGITRTSAGSGAIVEFTPNGAPVGTSITLHGVGFSATPAQNSVTFNGTAATVTSATTTTLVVSVPPGASTGTIFFACDVNVSILKPDASVLAAPTCMETSGFIDVQTLPSTGTSTILVDPQGTAKGSLTLTLHNVPTDTTGTVSVGGSAVSVPLSTPGRNGTLTFSGTASQQVTVWMTGNTFGSTTVKLMKPDGTQLATMTSSLQSFNLTTQTLPTTGTYTIVVDPAGASTGTINVSVTNP